MTEQEYEQKIQELEAAIVLLKKEKDDLIEVIKTYENMNVIQIINTMIKKYEDLETKFKKTESKIKQVEDFMNNESGINGKITKRLEDAIKNDQDVEETMVIRGGVSDAFATVMNLMGTIQTRSSQASITNE